MFSYNAVFVAQQHRLCPPGKLDLKQKMFSILVARMDKTST